MSLKYNSYTTVKQNSYIKKKGEREEKNTCKRIKVTLYRWPTEESLPASTILSQVLKIF